MKLHEIRNDVIKYNQALLEADCTELRNECLKLNLALQNMVTMDKVETKKFEEIAKIVKDYIKE
jgi:hypothetical protein